MVIRGEQVRGLMFCSRKEEAVKLSHALNDRGLRTVALTLLRLLVLVKR